MNSDSEENVAKLRNPPSGLSGRFRRAGCSHLDQVHDVTPSAQGCEECLKIGDEWVHLRLCLTCGHVGCCDDSKNKHATRHFRTTGHPIIASLEPGEEWLWCYVDEVPI
ncbi:MAG: UBP-type zinc finger domain-containing protein [Anaerolineae bacterium]|nr:UBP-type zinc finger domain-containing protein [Anaerolineae bacterium]